MIDVAISLLVKLFCLGKILVCVMVLYKRGRVWLDLALDSSWALKDDMFGREAMNRNNE